MALTAQNGALRLEGNALGTGQACCCDQQPDQQPDCDCACPNFCGYSITTSIEELTTTAETTVTHDECEQCLDDNSDTVENPKDVDDQVDVGGTNFVSAFAEGSSDEAYGQTLFDETYEYISENERRDYQRGGNAVVTVTCSVVDGVARWTVNVSQSFTESEKIYDTTNSPIILTKDRLTSIVRGKTVTAAVESCDQAPNITVVFGLDDVTINGTSHELIETVRSESCVEYPDGVPTAWG